MAYIFALTTTIVEKNKYTISFPFTQRYTELTTSYGLINKTRISLKTTRHKIDITDL